MKIAMLGPVALAAMALLAGCQSEDQNRRAQVRDHLVNQCNLQVQMAAQSGLPDMRPLCTCIATTIDAMPDEQFKQMTTNPLQASQFSQTINAHCMQRIGPSMMGGAGLQPGMAPGMPPGMAPNPYGGAASGAGANAADAANSAQ